MRFLLMATLISGMVMSCNTGNNNPDVSDIKIELKTKRFEEELFSLDTNQLTTRLNNLLIEYPSFGENFIGTILNSDPKWSADSAAAYIKSFISSYKSLYDSSQVLYADFTPYENQIKKSLQYLHYYFPAYAIPDKIITYIGPLDGYGDILDTDALIVGLHHHMGSQFSMYQVNWVRETYPDYISRRFEPSYIAINCMKNIILDMFPENIADKSLVIQMIEKGKRLYVLQKLVPFAKDYQLIGYTEKQLNESLQRETIIWDLFAQNNFLRSIDNNIIKNYIGESPKTQELGEASPGNIGSFCGWQIIKKYMNKYPETSLKVLMDTDAETLFQQAKYKP